jgi:chromate transporter
VTTGALFAILLKATFLSFSGFGSLPILHDELVTQRHILTDDDLNRAVAVARVTPGAMGSYVVAVGYAVQGWQGAVSGWVAMCAPALCVLPVMVLLRGRAHSGRWRDAADAVVLASAALVLGTASTLIPTAVVDPSTSLIAIGALLVVFFTSIPTIWIIIAGAVVSCVSAL